MPPALPTVYDRQKLLSIRDSVPAWPIARQVRKRIFAFKLWNPHAKKTNRGPSIKPQHIIPNVQQHGVNVNKDVYLPSMYLLNARSLAKPNAFDQLSADLTGYNTDVALITETHLKKKHNANITSIHGYRTFRRDREKRRGGGVAIFIRNDHDFTVLNTDNSVFEIIWVNLHGPSAAIIGVLYHPPKPVYAESSILQYLEERIAQFGNEFPGKPIALAGDFNSLTNEAIMEHTNLYEIVQRPTRGHSALDRIYVSQGNFEHIKITTSAINSDHLAVIAHNGPIKVAQNKQRKVITYRPRKPKQIANYLEKLSECQFNCSHYQDVETSFSAFYDNLLRLLNECFPLRQITISNNDPPFITPLIKNLLRKKNKLLHKGNKARAEEIGTHIGLLIAQNNANKLIHLSNKSSSQALWKSVREATRSDKHKLEAGANHLTASDLNMHYATISNDRNYSTPAKKSTANENRQWFTEHDVHRAIQSLSRTATGPDEVPYWALRVGVDTLSRPITNLLNKSLNCTSVPSMWKTATIVPVPKNDKPSVPSDYRPISLTSVLSRTCERLIVRRFLYPAMTKNAHYADQFAFLPTGSTAAAIIAITCTVLKILDTQRYVRVIAFDFSKAFDTVRHASVMNSLTSLDLPDNIFNWLNDFFSHRTHKTSFNGSTSETLSINSSVIQGSALGPITFTAVSSSLTPVDTGNYLFKYADDTYLLIPENNIGTTNLEIFNIQEWAQKNNLTLNTRKSKEIIFSRPRCKTALPEPLKDIPRVREINILGVIFNSTLKVNAHIQECINKCSACLYGLKILSSQGIGKPEVHHIFDQMIISRLLYAAPSWWGFATAQDKNRLLAFIKRSIKFGYCNPNKPDLQARITAAEEKLFQKIVDTEHHVLNRFLPPVTDHQYTLRPRRHSFCTPTLTENTKKSFFGRLLHGLL